MSETKFMGEPIVLAEFETSGDLRITAIRIPKAQLDAFITWLLDHRPLPEVGTQP
jgi:hypothetical protein